jgi:hypothetical protein
MGIRLVVSRCLDCKRILAATGTLALLAFLLGVSPQLTLAQSNPGGGVDDLAGAFQLESNATTDSAICFKVNASGAAVATPTGTTCPGGYTYIPFGSSTDDWQNGLGFAGGASHALATSFIGPKTNPAEQVNSGADTTFFGGGSKDVSGISSGPWETATTSVNAKDDIEDAFAAAYTMPSNGHVAIYFGMDRFDNSGDATAGFWFVQDGSISINGTKKGGGILWTGHHSNNDLLIVSDFSQGGAIGSIQAFKWSCGTAVGAACDSGGSLVSATALNTNGTCNPITGSSSFCAIVNDTDGLAVPWPFINKSGQTTYAHGEFLEGGIDLQTIFGSNIPCFSTFFAETRSSNSSTASLEDVTPPVSFPLCGMSVTKSCTGSQISADGASASYTFSATVSNDGIGPLYNVTLHDTLPDGTTSDIAVTLPDTCGLNACLGPKHTATVTGIAFTATTTNCHSGVTNCSTPIDVVNTVTAKAFSAPTGGTEIDGKKAATAECKVSPSSSITIEKHCDASKGGATLVDVGGAIEVEVFYTAKVCNTGTSQLTNISLADDHGSPVTHDTPSPGSIASLAPGACTSVGDITGSYFPNSIDSSVGRFGFTDTVRVTSATASLGSNPTPAAGCPASTDLACAPVTCPICFSGTCTTSGQP